VEAEPVATVHSGKTGVYSHTMRDLTKISEINQKIFRQQTPRAMLNTAVTENRNTICVRRVRWP